MSSRHARVQRGLGELDRPDVVLGDRDPRPVPARRMEDVGERPAVGDDPRRCARRAPRRSTPSVVMTPARNSSAITSMIPEPQIPVMPVSAAAAANAGSSDQARLPMTRKRGSSVAGSIRTRSIAPGAARWPPRDLGALEGRAGRARGGEQPVAVAEHDLGVRADVDDRASIRSALVRRLGEDHAGGVRADVAGDARQDVDARARDARAGRAPRRSCAPPGRWPARTARRPAASGRCRAGGGA